MRRLSYHISRIGLGITFLWIGVLIFRDPIGWSGYVQPWAAHLIPLPLVQVMVGTAFLDMIIGVFLLLNVFVYIITFVGAIHIMSVLLVSGITDITVRDIAILYCSVALMVDALPELIISRFPFLR